MSQPPETLWKGERELQVPNQQLHDYITTPVFTGHWLKLVPQLFPTERLGENSVRLCARKEKMGHG